MQSNTVILDHPLVQHKVSLIRDKNTSPKEFRELVTELTLLAAYEAFRNLPLEDAVIETPLVSATVKMLSGKEPCILPVLRAGLGMVDGVSRLLPKASIGHIGLYRDHETLLPVDYYLKLPPDVQERQVIVLDPMLATGGTTAAVIKTLRERGVGTIKVMCLIASQHGLSKLSSAYPDVMFYCCAVDEQLNDHGYIIPGLGDAGDRLFGTL